MFHEMRFPSVSSHVFVDHFYGWPLIRLFAAKLFISNYSDKHVIYFFLIDHLIYVSIAMRPLKMHAQHKFGKKLSANFWRKLRGFINENIDADA